MDLSDWLSGLGLGQHEQAFRDNAVGPDGAAIYVFRAVTSRAACKNKGLHWNWRDVPERPSLKPWHLAVSATPNTFAVG